VFGLTLGYAAPAEQRQLADALDVLAGRLGALEPGADAEPVSAELPAAR
jgi:hypothetical protein